MPWEKNFNVDDVLDRAMQAFRSQGYGATSMQDLVDCTGVNRASLYATYGDKRAMFIAALRKYIGEHCRRELEQLSKDKSARRAIEGLFTLFVDSGLAANRQGCFITNTALELATHDDEIGALVADAQKDFENFFLRMIRRGKSQGEFSPDLRERDQARALLSSLLGLAVLVRSRPDRKLAASIVKSAMASLR